MKTKDDQIIQLLNTLVSRFDSLGSRVDDMGTSLDKLGSRVDRVEKSLKKDIKNLDKKVEYFKTLDRDVSSDRRRIIGIEKHTDLPFNPLES